jgi:lysophospholipase L1-like esterase
MTTYRAASLCVLSLMLMTLSSRARADAASISGGTWSFGNGEDHKGAVRVNPETTYNDQTGYGFDLDSQVQAGSVQAGSVRAGGEAVSYCTSDAPFFFSVALPEGNYNVWVAVVGATNSKTTIKSETRRLMIEQLSPPPGKVQTVEFTTNIRTPEIAGGERVHINAREKNYLHWDNKLTLEFSGEHPLISSVRIEPAPDAVTVFLAGDSTVTDQPREPYNSWGQMLPRFFKPGVAVANYAESGETAGAFIAQKRLAKIESIIRSGDYLFIQFGHNDMKNRGPDAGAYKDYTAHLKTMIAAARAHGATPVLITPMNRRTFDKSGSITNSFGDYPDAVRKLAAEENVPLIDLNAMSKPFYEALGPVVSVRAFAPGDHTHHDDYGSYELAKCIVSGIIKAHLGLAKLIVDDWKGFDPAHPDPIDQFSLPHDPLGPSTRPEGS